jgi:hypothetical protein
MGIGKCGDGGGVEIVEWSGEEWIYVPHDGFRHCVFRCWVRLKLRLRSRLMGYNR